MVPARPLRRAAGNLASAGPMLARASSSDNSRLNMKFSICLINRITRNVLVVAEEGFTSGKDTTRSKPTDDAVLQDLADALRGRWYQLAEEAAETTGLKLLERTPVGLAVVSTTKEVSESGDGTAGNGTSAKLLYDSTEGKLASFDVAVTGLAVGQTRISKREISNES